MSIMALAHQNLSIGTVRENKNITASKTCSRYGYELHIIDKCPARNTDCKKCEKGISKLFAGLALHSVSPRNLLSKTEIDEGRNKIL